jgi:biotin operon repressor
VALRQGQGEGDEQPGGRMRDDEQGGADPDASGPDDARRPGAGSGSGSGWGAPGDRFPDVAPVPDLAPLALPAAEDALLRLLLHEGGVSTREAASRLGLSLSHVSNAAGALKDRGFAVAGLSRSHGLLLAPLDGALDALLAHRRARAEADLRQLERLRAQLLGVTRWRPSAESPHTLVPRDLREWERKEQLREVRDSLDLVVDRHHVNSHVPGDLIRVTKQWSRPVVRLLVTGTSDPRPMVVTGTLTDAEVAVAGIAVRRLSERSAAFAVYDDRRVEVPLWRLAASGWTDEPGEVRSAVRLFAQLWQEAVPWSRPRGEQDAGSERLRGVQSPREEWSEAVSGDRGVIGSAP